MRITKTQQVEMFKGKALQEERQKLLYLQTLNDIRSIFENQKLVNGQPLYPGIGSMSVEKLPQYVQGLINFRRENENGVNIQVAMLSQELSRVWYLLRAMVDDKTLQSEPQLPLVNPFPKAGF